MMYEGIKGQTARKISRFYTQAQQNLQRRTMDPPDSCYAQGVRQCPQ